MSDKPLPLWLVSFGNLVTFADLDAAADASGRPRIYRAADSGAALVHALRDPEVRQALASALPCRARVWLIGAVAAAFEVEVAIRNVPPID